LNMKPKELDDFIVECRDIIRASQFEDWTVVLSPVQPYHCALS
jgi:hypothetical protein